MFYSIQNGLVGILSQYLAAGLARLNLMAIPGVDDLKDAVVNGFIDGLTAVGQMLADLMSSWATWGIETALRILSNEGLPPPELFFDSPIAVIAGANYGLSVLILRGLIIVAVVVTMFTVYKQRQAKFAGTVLSTIWWLFLFGVLFFPLYTLGISLLRELGAVFLNTAGETSGGDISDMSGTLTAALLPGDVALQFINGLINGFVMSMLIVELGAMVFIGSGLTVCYPLNIAFRPLGKFGLNQFKFATATLISIPISLFVMVCLLALELLILRATNDFVPWLGAFGSFIVSLVFGCTLPLVPYLIFSLAYTKVGEIVGSTDSRIQSGVDVASMPVLDTRQIESESNRDRMSIVKEFGTQLPTAIAAGENSPMTEAKELGKQVVISKMAASANPYVAGATAAYTGVKMVQKVAKSLGGDQP